MQTAGCSCPFQLPSCAVAAPPYLAPKGETTPTRNLFKLFSSTIVAVERRPLPGFRVFKKWIHHPHASARRDFRNSRIEIIEVGYRPSLFLLCITRAFEHATFRAVPLFATHANYFNGEPRSCSCKRMACADRLQVRVSRWDP